MDSTKWMQAAQIPSGRRSNSAQTSNSWNSAVGGWPGLDGKSKSTTPILCWFDSVKRKYSFPSSVATSSMTFLVGVVGGAELLGEEVVTNVVGVLPPPPPVSPTIDTVEPHERVGDVEE
jgi:hypothetical protein